MFKGSKVKKILALSVVFVICLSTIAIAANEIYQKQLTATFGKVKVKVAGADVTNQIETTYGAPAFIANDRTYVPLRALELAGLQITWDPITNTAEIVDIKSMIYESELKKKDAKIAELEKTIKELEEKVVDEKDLADLEEKFNDLFGYYKGVYFDIELKEKTNRIDVNIYINLSKSSQRNSWNSMKESHIRDMIEYITDAISTEIKNVDIYGYIYDEYNKEDLVTFNKKKTSKSVSISFEDKTDYYRDLEDFVYDLFYDELGIEIDSFDLSTSGDRIYFDIEFAEKYLDDWYEMNETEREEFLDIISDEIIYYYEDDDYKHIYGTIIVDGYVEEEYYRHFDDLYGEIY